VKALVYFGPRRMELQEAPDPEPQRGEVVIRTAASAICGSDLHGFREASPRRVPPLVMGHETVGTIDAVGDAVDAARLGERVVLKPILTCGRCPRCLEGRGNLCAEGRLVGRDLAGGFAERFAVPASGATPIAASVPDAVATLTEPLANAVHVTGRSVRPGDAVLVIGAGPIGVLTAKMAIEHGASAVFSADRIASRLELARAQGAVPLAPDDPEGALAHAAGGAVDVVIDAVGLEATWGLALRTVRPGGCIEAVGLGAPKGVVDFFAVVGKEVRISGSFGWTDKDFTRAVDLVEAGVVDANGWLTSLPLAEGQRAFEELVDGTERFKVVLVP
jgi:2-desacetyl-2-hydroxyethyl bacteriochlorophyllide A dehydrogenase